MICKVGEIMWDEELWTNLAGVGAELEIELLVSPPPDDGCLPVHLLLQSGLEKEY